MDDDDSSIAHYNRFLAYVNNKRTRKSYKKRSTLEIEDETYDLKTNQIISTRKKIKIQHRIPWLDRYDPSILVHEDEGSLRGTQSFDRPLSNPTTPPGYYEENKRFCELIGDIPIEYKTYLNFYNFNIRMAHKVDKTARQRRLSTKQIEDRNLEPGEFFLRPKDYHQVIRSIESAESLNAAYKLHKSVHFTSETVYVPKDKPCPPSHHITKHTDFLLIGNPEDDNWIPGTTYRGRRELQEENRLQSILKIPTEATERNRYWEERLEFINENRTTYLSPEIRKRLFNELWHHQDNYKDWFDTTKSLTRSIQDLDKESNRQYFYYIDRKFRYELVQEAEQNYLKYTKVQNTLAKFYHSHVLNNYGIRYVYAPTIPTPTRKYK